MWAPHSSIALQGEGLRLSEGFRDSALKLKVSGRVSGFGSGFGFRVPGCGKRDAGTKFWVLAWGIRDRVPARRRPLFALPAPPPAARPAARPESVHAM